MLTPSRILPDDVADASLVGRVWLPCSPAGPAVVLVRDHQVVDISRHAPTVSALLEDKELLAGISELDGELVGEVEEILANSTAGQRLVDRPYFLAPIDSQAIKACGVTFVVSMLERVIALRPSKSRRLTSFPRVAPTIFPCESLLVRLPRMFPSMKRSIT